MQRLTALIPLTLGLFYPFAAQAAAPALQAVSNEGVQLAIKTALALQPEQTLVHSQLFQLRQGKQAFYIAPIVSTQPDSGGCYLQVLDAKYKKLSLLSVSANEGTESCDTVLTVYSCGLGQQAGLGVITAQRQGTSNYAPQGSFYDLSMDGDKGPVFSRNQVLSEMIANQDNAADARKQIGCTS